MQLCWLQNIPNCVATDTRFLNQFFCFLWQRSYIIPVVCTKCRTCWVQLPVQFGVINNWWSFCLKFSKELDFFLFFLKSFQAFVSCVGCWGFWVWRRIQQNICYNICFTLVINFNDPETIVFLFVYVSLESPSLSVLSLGTEEFFFKLVSSGSVSSSSWMERDFFKNLNRFPDPKGSILKNQNWNQCLFKNAGY